MTDKKEQLKEFTLKNPNLSANEIYNGIKGTPLGMRKTEALKIIRETRNLPEPLKIKREKSIPIKHRTLDNKIYIKESKLTDLRTKKPTVKIKQKIRQTVKEITKLDKEREVIREKEVKEKKEVKLKEAKEIKEAKEKEAKPPKIPYEQTKFGKIAKRMEKTHNISEKRAIERARAYLKIPRKDYHKLNRRDVAIILSESP